jgi:hypothetical protein
LNHWLDHLKVSILLESRFDSGKDKVMNKILAPYHKRVEERAWPDLVATWLMSDETPSPELWVLCDYVSMAESLAKHRPSVVDSLIAHQPEVVQFPDGSGAVVFVLHNGGDILNLVMPLFQVEYDQTVLVIAGAAMLLPSQDEAALMQLFNPSQKYSLNNDTLIWTA